MENVILTQFSTTEIRQMFRDELESYFRKPTTNLVNDNDENDFVDVKTAATIINKSVPTVYLYSSQRRIPHSKQGKKLYFSRRELLEWLRSGKRKTASEIQNAAINS